MGNAAGGLMKKEIMTTLGLVFGRPHGSLIRPSRYATCTAQALKMLAYNGAIDCV